MSAISYGTVSAINNINNINKMNLINIKGSAKTGTKKGLPKRGGAKNHVTSKAYFEFIRLQVLELAQARLEAECASESASGGSKRLGSIGHSAKDPDSRMIYATVASTRYDLLRQEVNAELEKATDLLYGKHGRGGLAKARSTTDADCICGYYLQGLTWQQVANELVRPDSKDGAQWCRRRAMRAFKWMDSTGFARKAMK